MAIDPNTASSSFPFKPGVSRTNNSVPASPEVLAHKASQLDARDQQVRTHQRELTELRSLLNKASKVDPSGVVKGDGSTSDAVTKGAERTSKLVKAIQNDRVLESADKSKLLNNVHEFMTRLLEDPRETIQRSSGNLANVASLGQLSRNIANGLDDPINNLDLPGAFAEFFRTVAAVNFYTRNAENTAATADAAEEIVENTESIADAVLGDEGPPPELGDDGPEVGPNGGGKPPMAPAASVPLGDVEELFTDPSNLLIDPDLLLDEGPDEGLAPSASGKKSAFIDAIDSKNLPKAGASFAGVPIDGASETIGVKGPGLGKGWVDFVPTPADLQAGSGNRLADASSVASSVAFEAGKVAQQVIKESVAVGAAYFGVPPTVSKAAVDVGFEVSKAATNQVRNMQESETASGSRSN